jgi:hypothetical protein
LGLGGAQAGNYSLTPVGNLNATITAKALTVTGQTALDKAFDGNTTAALSGGVLNGVLTDDLANVTLVRGTGAFASATPGTNKPVTVTGTDLAGTAKGNYSVSNPAGLTASITGSDVDTSEVVDRLVQTRSTNNPLNETRNTSDLLRNVAEQLRSTTRTEFGSSGNLAFQQQSGSSNRVDAEDAQRRGDAASTAKGTSTIAGRAKSQLDGYDDTRVSDALAERLGARAALPRGAAGGRGDAVPAGGLVSVTRETGEGESQGVDSPGSDGGGAAMRRQVAGTGAERERAEIRATASGGSRREAIGTGRIGGAGPGGGRLGTSSRGAGGRLGTTGGRLGTGGG